MRFSWLFLALSAVIWTGNATNDGLTTAVSWDQYSLTINGSRAFVYSAEFHYPRMPVPEMWLDIFQKFRANGFNAVSIYFFWSYHSASKGVYDFETSGKNLQRLFDYAKQAGLWVIARPGPYINGETNAGGFALWGSDGSMGSLRTNDETYHQSWLPWVTNLGKILAANEVSKGGPLILCQIENEYSETTHSASSTAVLYMEQIESAFRAAGVTIPFSSNEKGERAQSWSVDWENVGGAVNVYGLDSYPSGFSCTSPNKGFSVIRNYFQWFSKYSFTQPSYFPEFEGGYFTPWGGSFYDDCTSDHQAAFADVFYKNNIGQRITIQNLYMAYGGTNWGYLAAPVVYTSYDYSAPLRETRQIQNKLYQTKLVGLFTRASTDLRMTYMVGNGTGYDVDSSAIWTWVLRNPNNQAGFTVAQQDTTSSTTSVTFSAHLTTSQGQITVPNINLNGRQSKILVTDYNFGSHSLLYSSADILTYGVFDVDVLVLYLQKGQIGQFAFKNSPTAVSVTHSVYGTSSVQVATSNSVTTVTYTQGDGLTALSFSGVLVYLLDQPSAYKFWVPSTTTNPNAAANEQIFVQGPYLVRNASVSSGTVYISGDNDNATTIEVYTGVANIQKINWNGATLNAVKTQYGSVTAQISGIEGRTISLPQLSTWQSADSLPEKLASYDDSKWTVCNKTTTKSPVSPSTLPVLFASDYGYYTGAKVYRGYFDGTKSSVSITCSGGIAFGWNAWLNGVLLGGNVGSASDTTTSATLSLPSSALKSTNNVITVVVDYHGHDETSTTKGVENPRGILGASLNSGSFTKWKIAGNAGGSANIDPVRGPLNEGGLYGERLGWHLPGFQPSSSQFSTSSPLTGLSSSGIQFYITTFNLNLDSDLDVPLGIELSAPSGTVARVMIWVNGYQFGKFEPHIGPQKRFPVPPGIINYGGSNTLTLSLWAMTNSGAKLSAVNLYQYGAYQTGFTFNRDWSYLQPAWTDRSQYA